jgi:hypothetical protein
MAKEYAVVTVSAGPKKVQIDGKLLAKMLQEAKKQNWNSVWPNSIVALEGLLEQTMWEREEG